MLDPEHKTFGVYIVSLSSSVAYLSSILLDADVYPSRKPQIACLIAKKAFTKVPTKYSNFADVFLPDLASKLLKYIGIIDHAIELVNS